MSAEEDAGGSATGSAERADGGRRASLEEDDDAGVDEDEPPSASADGEGEGKGEGDEAVAQALPEDADDAATGPPPETAEPAAPQATAADEAQARQAQGASAAPEPAGADAAPDGSAATDSAQSASAPTAKRGRRASKRAAEPDAGASTRRGRRGWGRATPPAPAPLPGADAAGDAAGQATVPSPDAGVPATPAADAHAPPPATPEADAPPAPPPPAAAAPPPPSAPAPPADFGDTAAMLPPSDDRDAAAPPPAPPPLEPPPPPVPLAAAAPTGIGEAPTASGDASIVLTPEALALGAAGVPAVEAGLTLSYNATIRNESRLVDNYELSVLGLPEGWSVVTPPTAFLVPLGSGRGESDTTVRIDISPPRSYRSTAGIWTFELIAMSRTTATVAGRAIAQFEVKPFPSWSVEAVPVVNSGRLKARYRVAVRNDGNADQELWLLALEDSGRLRTRFRAGSLILQPGSVGVDMLTLRPRLPLPVGRTKEHRVGVDAVDTPPEVDEDALSLKQKLAAQGKEKGKDQGKLLARGVKLGPGGVTVAKPRMPNPAQIARSKLMKLKSMFKPDMAMLQRLRSAGEAAGPLTARQVVFRQKPIIPLWLIGLVLLLALIGVAIYLLLPKEVKVPQLVGAKDTFVVEKRLRDADLVLSQPVQKRIDTADPGSVIEQSPAAGVKLEKGSAVSVVVADSDATVEVPHLKGLTRVEADKRLRQFGLELGETRPDDAADNFVVRSQIPAEDLRVDRGTAVRVFLEKPKKKAAKKKAAAKGGGGGGGAAGAGAGAGGGGGGGGGGAAASIAVPAFKGKKLGAYTKLLTDLGLRATISRALSKLPENTVLRVEPRSARRPSAAAR